MENNTLAWKQFAKEQCTLQGVPWSMYEKQIQQESGWRHYNRDGTIITSRSGAKGLGQIMPNSHPNANWVDPIENLRYSINLMASHYKRFGSWRKALAAYNWGPGNVGGYTDSSGKVHNPWDGTRNWQCQAGHSLSSQVIHYLDVILGPDWLEPGASMFTVGQGILDLMAQHGDSPATDELYFKNDLGQDQYSQAFAQSGALYVYMFSTGLVHRFPAD